VYVVEGELSDGNNSLAAGGYAFYPHGSAAVLSARAVTRAAVIEKPYQALPGLSPPLALSGSESNVPGTPFMGDDALHVRMLLPADAAFDLAVNTMTFQPGATLPMVEIHVMEHGLLMLEGEGIYRLGDHWYPVAAGDFIWMAPYCPQWFGALG